MTRRHAESSKEHPYHWTDEEINRYLALHHRSLVDIAFTRGEKPS